MPQAVPPPHGARMPGLERLGIALLWLAAAAASVVAPDSAAPRAPHPAPPALQRLLEPVAPGAGVVLAGARGGDVWWVTRDAVVRFAAGEPEQREVVADLRERPRRRGRTAAPFTAAHLDGSGRVWLGTGTGEVMVRDAAGRWLASFPSVGHGRVHAIATRAGEVYVAAGGLWHGSLDGDGLHPVTGFVGRSIEHVTAHSEHGLATASRRRVWLREGGGWRRVWHATTRDDAVCALAFSRSGELWVGTGDGLVRLGRDGSSYRELAGTRVETLSESRAGVAFAGTRDAGLFTRYAGGWHRVGAAGNLDLRRVSALAPGARGALWLALGERGLFRAGG